MVIDKSFMIIEILFCDKSKVQVWNSKTQNVLKFECKMARMQTSNKY